MTQSLTNTSVYTSASAAAYEALINKRNGDTFETSSTKNKVTLRTSGEEVGLLVKAGTEVGLIVIVITGVVEFAGRTILHIIAKVASFAMKDYSRTTGEALKMTTGATVSAAIGLYRNLCGKVSAGDTYNMAKTAVEMKAMALQAAFALIAGCLSKLPFCKDNTSKI
jgi:hypothetical protein